MKANRILRGFSFSSTVIVLTALLTIFSSTAAQVCLSETNDARRAAGVPALSNSAQLVAAAQAHNKRMLDSNCFSHQCPGEPSLGNRATATGYRWGRVAENIHKGAKNCRDVVNGWLNSPGHKANLLNRSYIHVGCATGNNIWTCVYAQPL